MLEVKHKYIGKSGAVLRLESNLNLNSKNHSVFSVNVSRYYMSVVCIIVVHVI